MTHGRHSNEPRVPVPRRSDVASAPTQPIPRVEAPAGDGQRRHRRPSWVLRTASVFLLVLGTSAGIYAGVRPSGEAQPAVLPAGTPSSTVDGVGALADVLAAARARAQQAAAEEAARAKRAEQVAQREQQGGSGPVTAYPVPASCDEYSGNRALGCALLLDAGFGLDQMPCLEKLWTKESNWNPNSHNKSSGAHGIPQALPGEKMAEFGDDWETNPVTQIKWGLSYIENRYKTPCNAWAHFQAKNWY